jgi:hypothetical protein
MGAIGNGTRHHAYIGHGASLGCVSEERNEDSDYSPNLIVNSSIFVLA